MRNARSGPSGTGLIPPGAREPGPEDDPQGQDEELDDAGADDIDGMPPADETGEDGDGDAGIDDDGDAPDDDDVETRIERIVQARLAQVEADFQRRFDRAVSKQRKKLERRAAPRSAGAADDDDGDDDDRDDTGPAGKRRRPQVHDRGADVTSIRLLARDQIADELADAGKAERLAVKRVVDLVLPAVDWSEVDQEEFVADLVSGLKEEVTALVKEGSDRKLAQLRRMGRLPARQGQPPSGGGSGRRNESESAMDKGASVAARRFPGGKRRLYS